MIIAKHLRAVASMSLLALAIVSTPTGLVAATGLSAPHGAWCSSGGLVDNPTLIPDEGFCPQSSGKRSPTSAPITVLGLPAWR